MVADGSIGQSSGMCLTKLRLGNSIFHQEDILLTILDTSNCDLILGFDWLIKHHVNIDFGAGTTIFHCNPSICCKNTEPDFATEDDLFRDAETLRRRNLHDSGFLNPHIDSLVNKNMITSSYSS
jgi:hypothetical protein